MTGGGVQTPGFMGHGRHFIGSKKFASAEGGIARIVWMPKELKDDVSARAVQAAPLRLLLVIPTQGALLVLSAQYGTVRFGEVFR